MAGTTKLMTAGGGGVNIQPASSIASDVTVNVPVTGVNNGTLVCSDSSGNVGIGTSSPASKLAVNIASAGDYITLQTGGATKGVIGDESGNLIVKSAAAMLMQTNGSERMRIDSSGNLVGQGSTVTSGSNNIWWIGTYNNTTGSAANMVVASNGSFARSTSSLKYKQDIRDLESIDVNKFRPVRYKSKCENDDQTIDHFGLIADEVDAAGIKELVSYGAEGEVEGFQYERLTVVLLKAIQELSAKNDALEARIAALEAK